MNRLFLLCTCLALVLCLAGCEDAAAQNLPPADTYVRARLTYACGHEAEALIRSGRLNALPVRYDFAAAAAGGVLTGQAEGVCSRHYLLDVQPGQALIFSRSPTGWVKIMRIGLEGTGYPTGQQLHASLEGIELALEDIGS